MFYIFWKKKFSGDKGVKDQFKVIFGLLKKVSSVVNVGDFDEEGQFFVDEILEYVGCILLVKWVFINDNNIKVVCKVLESMCDNCEFVGLLVVVEVCSVGDQFYGYNMICVYILVVCQKGYQGVMSVGWVQIFIVGFVVCCMWVFKVYRKVYYYNVIGWFEVEGVVFFVWYQIVEVDLVDEKGWLIEEQYVQVIVDVVKGKFVWIVSVDIKQKEQYLFLFYNLLKL